jgi:hypothetical protein
MLFKLIRHDRFTCGGMLMDALELLFEAQDLLVVQILQVDQARARALNGAEQLVEFELDGYGVPVLCVLDEEDKQERDDGRSGIYRTAPSIREVKQRSTKCPHDNDRKG